MFIRHYPYFRLKRVRKERGKAGYWGECVCRKDVAVMFVVEIHHDALLVCSCIEEVRFGVVIQAAWDEILVYAHGKRPASFAIIIERMVRFWCIRVEKGCVNALIRVRDWLVFAILHVIIIWIGVPYGGF